MSGPYSDSSASGSMPYSSAACVASCSRRSRCSLREISVPCAVFTTLSSSPDTVVSWARTALSASVPLAARLLGLGSPLRRERQRRLGGGHRGPRPRGDRAGDRRLGGPLLAPDGGPLPGGPLGGGRGGERVGPAADRAQPLLDGAHLEARLHLGVPRGRGALGQFLALVVGLQVLELRVARALVRGLAPRRARPSAARAWPGPSPRCAEPRPRRRRAAWPRRRRPARPPPAGRAGRRSPPRPRPPPASGRGSPQAPAWRSPAPRSPWRACPPPSRWQARRP